MSYLLWRYNCSHLGVKSVLFCVMSITVWVLCHILNRTTLPLNVRWVRKVVIGNLFFTPPPFFSCSLHPKSEWKVSPLFVVFVLPKFKMWLVLCRDHIRLWRAHGTLIPILSQITDTPYLFLPQLHTAPSIFNWYLLRLVQPLHIVASYLILIQWL